MKKALADFLKLRLRLSPIFLSEMGEVSMKKVASALSDARIQGEIIAVFATVEVRDAIRRAAKELAGNKDAGIRLEIPYSLQSSLKALEFVSFHLKKKNPEIRRNIKFDDQLMDLVLDFNTNPANPDGWKKVTAEQAKLMKTKITAATGRSSEITNDELGGLLDMS